MSEDYLDDTSRPVRRHLDRSNREVKQALQSVLDQFSAWRAEMAMLNARTARGEPGHGDEMRLRCDAILQGIAAAHEELLLDFADAPAEISGHGRVADVEKALDQLELELGRLRARLLLS